MTKILGRGRRNRKRVNYLHLNKTGEVEESKMAKPKRKKPVNKGKKKNTRKPEDTVLEENSQSDKENEEENLAGPSRENNEFEMVDDLHSDMGGGSNSSEHDTSDVDSEEMETQQKELEELTRQLEEKRSKRSNQERRERKAKMAEMRKRAEETRRQLQELNSDSEGVSEPKKRKLSKSKDGKGVKSSKKNKGKITQEKQKEKSLKENKANKTRKIVRRVIRKKAISDSSSSSSESSSDEISRTVKNMRKKYSEKKKDQNAKKEKFFSAGRKTKHGKGITSSESVDSSADSSTSTNSSSSDESSSAERDKGQKKRYRRKHKRGKPIKSGVKAKAHKIRLKTSELCAQAVLDEEYCPGTHSLEDLSFDQLVAGELEICTMTDIPKKEKMARLKILKLLAYFASLVPQKVLLEIYKAVILKIEKGIFTWSAEIVEKTENMLDRAVSKNKSESQKETETQRSNKLPDKNKDKARKEPGIQLKNGDRVVYCADFNKNKCDKDNSHEGKFGGKEVIKLHVCRNCLIMDREKRSHPETDEKCPNKAA